MNMKAEMKRSRDLKQLNNEIPFPINFGLDTGQLKSPIPINTSNVFCPHSDTFSCSCGVPVTVC